MGKANRAFIISHWYQLIDSLQGSTVAFYDRVQKAIADRQVPKLEPASVEFREGGMLSAKRQYLRLSRERLVFDICAAPFGTGFFVSWRLGEMPRYFNPLLALLLLAGVLFVFGLFIVVLGPIVGVLLILILLVGAIFLMRSGLSKSLIDVDAALLSLPILGALYERFFRTVTYYRIDLALMYQQAVHSAVMEAIDELTNTAGITPLSELERRPILSELYRR